MTWTSVLLLIGIVLTSCDLSSVSLSGPERFARDVREGTELHRVIYLGSKYLIYKGIDRLTNRHIILKYVVGHRGGALLRHEFNTLHQLNHPGIPQVIEYYRHDAWHVLAMELIPGHNLSCLPISLNPDYIPHYFAQLLSIVHYLHSQGIGHLNIDPTSVMLTHDHRVYLMDYAYAEFGLGATTGMPAGARDTFENFDPTILATTFGMSVDYFGLALVLHTMAHMPTTPIMHGTQPTEYLRTSNVEFNRLISLLTHADHGRRWVECFTNWHQLQDILEGMDPLLDWSTIHQSRGTSDSRLVNSFFLPDLPAIIEQGNHRIYDDHRWTQSPQHSVNRDWIYRSFFVLYALTIIIIVILAIKVIWSRFFANQKSADSIKA